jgi:hypothetical protein
MIGVNQTRRRPTKLTDEECDIEDANPAIVSFRILHGHDKPGHGGESTKSPGNERPPVETIVIPEPQLV